MNFTKSALLTKLLHQSENRDPNLVRKHKNWNFYDRWQALLENNNKKKLVTWDTLFIPLAKVLWTHNFLKALWDNQYSVSCFSNLRVLARICSHCIKL